jgi:copper transport protein
VILAFAQVEHIEPLWSTDYGRLLIAKLVVVAAAFAIAAWNRFALTQRIYRGELTARRTLVRTISVELVLATIVLALVATWRFTPPPRSLAAAAAQPIVLTFHTSSAFANVAFTPGRAGRVSVSMIIMTGNLELLDAKAVTVTMANPAAGYELPMRLAYKPNDGSWRIDALIIPVGGLWSARVEITMRDSTVVTLEDRVEIRP